MSHFFFLYCQCDLILKLSLNQFLLPFKRGASKLALPPVQVEGRGGDGVLRRDSE